MRAHQRISAPRRLAAASIYADTHTECPHDIAPLLLESELRQQMLKIDGDLGVPKLVGEEVIRRL
jgi:hypothetical protein